MAIWFADRIHIAPRLAAVAGPADLYAARQLLLPLHMMKDFAFRLPVGDKRRQLFRRDGLGEGNAPQGRLTLKIAAPSVAASASRPTMRHGTVTRSAMISEAMPSIGSSRAG